MQEDHKVSSRIKLYVVSVNVGIALFCLSWMPWWFTGDSWDVTLMFAGLLFYVYINALVKEVRVEMTAFVSAYRRFAIPVSAAFFFTNVGVQLVIALAQHREAVWVMAALSVVVALVAPIAAWFEPLIIGRRLKANQALAPTAQNGRG